MTSLEAITASSSPRQAVGAAGALVAVTAAGLWLRLSGVAQSLWVDELHTAWTVWGSWLEIAPRAAAGNLSPLYSYLAWCSLRLVPHDELALRLPALIAGSLLVPGLYLLTRAWTGSRTAGLLAATLAAVDEHCIFYAQEARPYALVQLAAIAHAGIFWQLMRRGGTRWRIAWVAGGWLLFYLHYTAALLVLAQLLAYALVQWAGSPCRYRPGALAVDLAIALAGWLPAVPHLWDIGERRHRWALFITDASPAAVATALPLAVWLLPLVAVAAAIGFASRRDALAVRAPDTRLVILTTAWLLVPLGLVWFTTASGLAPLLLTRYVLGSTPAVFLAAALAAASFQRRPLRLAAAAVFLAAALAALGGPRVVEAAAANRHEDWRTAAARLNQLALERPLPVFVRSGLIECDDLAERSVAELLRDYCLLPVRTLYPLDPNLDPHPLPTRRAGQLAPGHVQRARDAGGGWFMLRARPSAVPRLVDDLVRSLDFEQPHVERYSFGGVTLVLVARET